MSARPAEDERPGSAIAIETGCDCEALPGVGVTSAWDAAIRDEFDLPTRLKEIPTFGRTSANAAGTSWRQCGLIHSVLTNTFGLDRTSLRAAINPDDIHAFVA